MPAPTPELEPTPAEQAVARFAATDLFISDYIEGSFNKAIEIYNGTGADIDLSDGPYTLEIYFNGSSTAGATIVLTGTLALGDVYVVANDGAGTANLAEPSTPPSTPSPNATPRWWTRSSTGRSSTARAHASSAGSLEANGRSRVLRSTTGLQPR